jgi:hypothetical protein
MARSLVRVLALSLLLGLPGLARAQTAVASQQGVDAFNQELRDVWTRLRPAALVRLTREAETRLAAVDQVSGNTEVKVDRVRSVQLTLDEPPGFTHIATDRLGLAVPLRGEWAVRVDADVRVKTKVLFARPTFKFPITVIVHGISLRGEALLDDTTDPDRPALRSVAPPTVRFDLDLRSSGLFRSLLFRLLSPIADHLAHKFLDDALRTMAPNLQNLAGLPGPVPGDGAALYTDSGTPTELPTVVLNVDRKVRRDHMPHGSIVEAHMDTPASDTWAQAYGPGGPGNAGQVTDYFGWGDSAIWTGHYLAAEAFRWHETQDPDALDNVRFTVAGIGHLLDVNGGSGLLARCAAPASSVLGRQIIAGNGVFRQATINGETWVGTQGGNGISRDQYSGAFFGLAITHDLVADAQVQAECKARLVQMLDYLVRTGWFVDEDRPAFDGTQSGGSPTFWLGTAYQKLAFLLIGERVAPGRYAAELVRWAPLAEVAWTGNWLEASSLDSYYKFNLMHVGLYNYFRLENDPARWASMLRAFRMTSRFVGKHHNPHFELVRASAEPALQGALFPAIREALRRFLDRTHRYQASPTLDFSRVTYTTVAVPGFDIFGGGGVQTRQETLPSEPLDIVLRGASDFLWQRSPFGAATPGQGDPLAEPPGVDLLLPYWMGRYHGAF